MDQAYSRSDFMRMALDEFPELQEEFTEFDGLLHLQMAAVARHAQQAKAREDWPSYKRVVRLVHELWRRPDHELYNALNLSFLENIDFDGPRGPAAWALLTPELQAGWKAMKAYNDSLTALPRKQRGKKHK